MSYIYTPTNSPLMTHYSATHNALYNMPVMTQNVVVTDKLVITPPYETILTPRMPSVISDAPYVASLNLSYSKPLFTAYENLNADPKVHNQLVNYFRYKTLDKWLFGDLKHLLGYLKYSGGKVVPIDKLDDYTSKLNDTNEIINAKINYIEKNILTKILTFKILKRFVYSTNTNWYDLAKNEEYVQQAIDIGLKKHLKQLIK